MKITQSLPQKGQPVYNAHLKMGGLFTDGIEYSVNNRYMTKNGMPWIPVMGEFHFTRYPRTFWREELLKMKAAGITIVATYLFWIHHEEERGTWLWEGERDLGHFIDLCKQLELQVWLRVGPWAHGECRNGGFPDWLMELSTQKGVVLRSNDKNYLACVGEWFDQIARQLPHETEKFIQPIIGIQLENEYGHCGGAGSADHVRTLKRMALEAGLKAPFYSVTGWGGACVPQDEVLVTMGGYAAHPWTRHTRALEPLGEYLFAPVANDPRVGGDLSENKNPGRKQEALTWDPERTPYLTCELGGGIQVTDHRRPLLSRDDIAANVLCKIGSGTNLPGYYMYHGGTNPKGRFSTLQESKESGYPNDLPVFSYDFQAMIGEYGRFSGAGLRTKAYHYFLSDYGSLLAPMDALFPYPSPVDPAEKDFLRWSVRTNGRSGFVFVNNHVRNLKLPEQKHIEITLESAADEQQRPISFPSFDLAPHKYGFFPFNLDISGTWGQGVIKTALVQPVSRVDSEGKTTLYFFNFLEKPGEIELEVDGDMVHLSHGTGTEILSPLEGLELYILNASDLDRLWIGQVKDPQGKSIKKAVFSDYPVLFDPDKPACIKYREEPSLLKVNAHKKSEGEIHLDLSSLVDNLSRSKEIYLELDLICDKAVFYINGSLQGDFYYYGRPWIIGLKRFETFSADCPELIVKMTALPDKKEVYFDCKRPRGREFLDLRVTRVFSPEREDNP